MDKAAGKVMVIGAVLSSQGYTCLAQDTQGVALGGWG